MLAFLNQWQIWNDLIPLAYDHPDNRRIHHLTIIKYFDILLIHAFGIIRQGLTFYAKPCLHPILLFVRRRADLVQVKPKGDRPDK